MVSLIDCDGALLTHMFTHIRFRVTVDYHPSIHPSIHPSSTAYPGRRGSRLSRDTQTSLSLDTPSSAFREDPKLLLHISVDL